RRLRNKSLRSVEMKLALPALAVLLFTTLATPAEPLRLGQSSLDELGTLYRHFHQHPELSFGEEKTAKRIADELAALGFEVTPKVGGHGLVALLENGAGPTVMIRADMDALPVEEATGVDYASTARAVDIDGLEKPVMHACGHDVHITNLIGTARSLVATKDRWRGTLMMIAQPAEERGAGAKAMLDDGLFTRFPRPDFNLALHVNAAMPAGTIGYVAGPALANVDSVDITVLGVGGHGAYPHLTKDPVVLAAEIVLALQTIVSRELSAQEPAVITVGSIHGGHKHNVIPDEVKMQLTLRSYTEETRQHMIESIKRITRNLAMAANLPSDRLPIVAVKDEFTPVAFNDPELTRRAVEVFETVVGPSNVQERTPTMGGEDFGRYGQVTPKIPSLIFWLGAVDQTIYEASQQNDTPLPSLHSAKFIPAYAPTIKTGVEAMVNVALALLTKP
ncbi:MAG: amidohydrolase, partial [Pseudomonadota bacterium]